MTCLDNRRVLHLSRVELLVLTAVAVEPFSHAAAVQNQTERLGHSASLPAVYAALERLETLGLLETTVAAARPERGGRARRQFALTRQGQAALRTERESSLRLWNALDRALRSKPRP